jgi:hypothetical protein
MVINTTISTPSGNARRFTLASSAPFGALVCRLLALPSLILTHRGSANSGLGFGTGLGFGPTRLALAVVRPAQWEMMVVDNGADQRMAPRTAQGYGRSAPIARRC